MRPPNVVVNVSYPCPLPHEAKYTRTAVEFACKQFEDQLKVALAPHIPNSLTVSYLRSYGSPAVSVPSQKFTTSKVAHAIIAAFTLEVQRLAPGIAANVANAVQARAQVPTDSLAYRQLQAVPYPNPQAPSHFDVTFEVIQRGFANQLLHHHLWVMKPPTGDWTTATASIPFTDIVAFETWARAANYIV